VVVVGDSDFATNAYGGVPGNLDFFANSINWLAQQENLIAIRPKEARTTPVFLTATQGYVVFWLPVVVLPVAMIVAGMMALARKRGK